VAHIEKYVDTVLSSRCANTANSHLSALKSFWSWHATRHAAPNIAAGVPKLRPTDPVQRVITEDEYAKLLPACRPLERDLIQLYGNTGLRRQEMVSLRWAHVAPDLQSLRIPDGKGGKPRTVPTNGVCRDILTRNRVDNTFLFLQRYRSANSHDRLGNRLAGRILIPPFGPHALRHFFATRMIRAGVPLKIVSKILGHSSIAITEQIYCHLVPLDLIGTTEGLAM
jgi:integrase